MCEACTEFHPLWPPMRKPKAESETKPEGESGKPETESRKPKAEHLKPKAENQKRKQSENGGRKPKAGNRKPKAETESRKPKTESRKRDESESERVSADRNSTTQPLHPSKPPLSIVTFAEGLYQGLSRFGMGRDGFVSVQKSQGGQPPKGCFGNPRK